MKKSRERTILIAVLSLAGFGLLVDRVFLGADVTGPAESSAGVIETAADAPTTADTTTQTTAAAAKPAADRPSIAQRLRRLADTSDPTATGSARDAFTPAPGWNGGTGAEAAPVQPRVAQAFRDNYVLDAVLDTAERKCAVVNGRTVYVGQSIDGYELLSVYKRSAVFRSNDVRIELVLSGGR